MCGFFKKLFGKKKAKQEAPVAPKQEEKVFLEAEIIEDDNDNDVDTTSPELVKDETVQEVVQDESPIEEAEVVNEEETTEEIQQPVEEVQEVQEEVVDETVEDNQEEIIEQAQEEQEDIVDEPNEVIEEEVVNDNSNNVQEEVIEEDKTASLWEPVALDGTAEDNNEVEVKEKKPAKKAAKKPAKKVEKPVEKPVEEVKDTKVKQYVTPLTADDKLIIEGNPDIPHGKFVIKKTDKGNFVYKLFSYNHRVVCIGGEQYKSQVTCKNGINSVINNCKDANIEDQTLRNWSEEKCPKWQIYKDKQQLFRFRLLATNGQSIATTNDGYTTKDSAKRGIEAIKRASEGADVIRNDVLW